jgi:hypothetical protein
MIVATHILHAKIPKRYMMVYISATIYLYRFAYIYALTCVQIQGHLEKSTQVIRDRGTSNVDIKIFFHHVGIKIYMFVVGKRRVFMSHTLRKHLTQRLGAENTFQPASNFGGTANSPTLAVNNNI